MNTLYQPGIFEPIPAVARYVVFALTEQGQKREAVQEALRRLSPLANGSDVVLGIGQSLVAALGAEVPGLHEFGGLSGHGVTVPSTPGTLWCWVRGEDLGDLLHLTRKVQMALSPAFAVRHVVEKWSNKSDPLCEELSRFLHELSLGVKATELGREIAREGVRAERQHVAAQVRGAYFDLVASQAAVDGFLQDYYSEAFRRERERGRQPPDSGAGDEDGARRRHRTTRSGGLILDDAFGRAGLARLQVGRETKQGRAVRTDDLVIVA